MAKRKLTDKQEVEIARLYRNYSIPLEEICKMFDVSDDTVVRAMKRRDIPMRVTTGYCGEKNSNWKGGKSLRFAKNLALRAAGKNECMVCGYNTSTDVHHWDGNSKNNNPKNLILLCPNHHREVHLRLITRENLKKISTSRGGPEVGRVAQFFGRLG